MKNKILIISAISLVVFVGGFLYLTKIDDGFFFITNETIFTELFSDEVNEDIIHDFGYADLSDTLRIYHHKNIGKVLIWKVNSMEKISLDKVKSRISIGKTNTFMASSFTRGDFLKATYKFDDNVHEKIFLEVESKESILDKIVSCSYVGFHINADNFKIIGENESNYILFSNIVGKKDLYFYCIRINKSLFLVCVKPNELGFELKNITNFLN